MSFLEYLILGGTLTPAKIDFIMIPLEKKISMINP
jgi:hypothetical protein